MWGDMRRDDSPCKAYTKQYTVLSSMDGYTVACNAQGRQIDSFTDNLNIPALGEKSFSATFIRAYWIVSVDYNTLDVLARYKGNAVFVKQYALFASSFHPELNEDDLRGQRYFVENVLKAKVGAL